jgi:hypothetical protein
MNELIQTLQQKTGLTNEQASEAVTHVLDYIKSKLPESLRGYVDSAASGTDLTDELKLKAENLLSSLTSKFNF